MDKFLYLRTLITPLWELFGVYCAFISGYLLRGYTDGIPFVQLRIPTISEEQFFPFIIYGMILWGVLFGIRGLYTIKENIRYFDEIISIIKSVILWIIIYIFIVYLGAGFIFSKEIPRLIILYVAILSTFNSLFIRGIFQLIRHIGYKRGLFEKNIYLVLVDSDSSQTLSEDISTEYITYKLQDIEAITTRIEQGNIGGIINMTHNIKNDEIAKIILLTRIYGIPFMYPKYINDIYNNHSGKEFILGGTPVIELTSINIGTWQSIIKRIIDILVSALGLIVLFPLLCLIGLFIKIEDPSGPVIFRNKRIGKNGKEFYLYKFRYMYWKYCIKDAYGIKNSEDSALKYEEELKGRQDSRKGPLYKIANDPRKTRFGKWIERLSLDEIPQLLNVLRGEMSLIGPRPHQPREVELYDEEDKQVLNIKPGITGMAQVYGRDKNSFKKEVALDRYYIENYSLLLDLLIFLRTFFVVISRIFTR